MAELIEQAYAPLVQGVSQQRPKDRQAGQVSLQENMSSDIAFGLRRRAPSQYRVASDIIHIRERCTTSQTAISGQRCMLLVDTGLSTLYVHDSLGNIVYQQHNSYLGTDDSRDIQFATVDGTVFVANTSQTASEESASNSGFNPDLGGYAFIVASVFARTYSVTLRVNGSQYTGTYTTPNGNSDGDAAQSTANYIMSQVRDSLVDAGATDANGIHLVATGGTLTVRVDSGRVNVSTNSGDTYLRTSGTHSTNNVSDLPPVLHSSLNNFTMTVGRSGDPRYYVWDNTNQVWNEDSAYNARTRPTGMPLALEYNNGNWSLGEYNWERRTAGDVTSNESFNFLVTGKITGLSAFQGRLVILSGEYVCMSASNKPYRWYRSTVESLKADDPIEIASTTSIAAAYRRAVVFNKDLICFSDGYQAIIAGSQAVTPSNAAIAISSTYECYSDVLPASTGQSMLFAAPRTSGYSSVWEASPSPYIDSSILGNDVTNHTPTYMQGRIDWIRSSSTVGLAVIALREEPNTLYVNEYLWNGSDKAQSAWHKWTFPSYIVEAQIIESTLWLLVGAPNGSLWVSMDTRMGTGDIEEGSLPHLDYYNTYTATASDQILVNRQAAEAMGDTLVAYKMRGLKTDVVTLQGDYPHTPITLTKIRTEDNGDVLYQALGVSVGDLMLVGRPYLSCVQLTPPILRDSGENAVTAARKQVYKYMVQVYNTGDFRWSASDQYHDTGEIRTSAYGMYSKGFTAGKPRVGDDVCVLPARVNMNSTALTLATDSVYDLNIAGVEYSFRYMQRQGRRR